MRIRAHCKYRGHVVCGCVLLASAMFSETAAAQVQLPEVVVSAPKEKPRPPRQRNVRAAPPTAAPVTPAVQLNAKADAFNTDRNNLYTTIGTTADVISHATIRRTSRR